MLSGYDVYENENQMIKCRRHDRTRLSPCDKEIIENIIRQGGKICKRQLKAKVRRGKHRRKHLINFKNDLSIMKFQMINVQQHSKYKAKEYSLDLSRSTQEANIKQQLKAEVLATATPKWRRAKANSTT